VLVKVTSKPGLVYQQDLNNEIASLSTINRQLPASPYFPVVYEHGHLRDGRVYLITSLFDEFPLATAIATERLHARIVAYLRTTIEVAKALTDIHGLGIVHVDLNPMNILHRTHKRGPVVRIVDFESSYEVARHSQPGAFYSPPTTPGYSAPAVSHRPPDARTDLFSLGAVLYTMMTGFEWSWDSDITTAVEADHHIDPELKAILSTAVAVDPGRRFPSVATFHSALGEYLEHIWPGRSW
jgi:serine/threonine protein kinase